MSQQKIKMNGIEVWQPDKDLSWNWEPTYAPDSQRVMTGSGHFTPLFTVEQLGYKATHVPADKVSEILKIIAGGGKFTLWYYSPYYGQWREGLFYVGQGQSTIRTVKEGKEYFSDISFNMTGNEPLGR